MDDCADDDLYIDMPIERTPEQITGLYNLITLRGLDDCTDPEGTWAAEGKEHAYLMAHAGVLAWVMGRDRPQPNLNDPRVWDILTWLHGGTCPIRDDGHSLHYQPSVPPARHARYMQERAAKRAELSAGQ